MIGTRLHSMSSLAGQICRPTIVEAKLINEKHAQDPVYVATLAEELHAIEGKLSAMETALHIESTASPGNAAGRLPWPEAGRSAEWIKDKGRELDQRLRRVEELGTDLYLRSPNRYSSTTLSSRNYA